ncbi:hypothetical protein J4G08_09685 [Candidatus Poribacteria bacterium]|nr:hypothetical protein [Candidatus Poribacteria bacterium]
MMTSKLGSLFLIISIVTLIAFTGCTRVQDVVMDSMLPEVSMVEAVPVKFVLLIDYPEGEKDVYIEWVKSLVPTLQAPEEVRRIRSYDNQDQTMSPNRLVEYEFDSFLDMAMYLNRPEIADIMSDIPNHATNVTVHTFIQRSDYAKTDEGNWPVKGVLLLDYPLGGKQAYLDWVESVSATTIGPSQLKTIASYDNYYGESPHRLVEFEFANSEDSTTYGELEDIKAIEAELDVRTGSWTQHTFELRSDYINE